MRRKIYLGVLTLFLLGMGDVVGARENKKEIQQNTAQEVAYSWLKLLDQHKFPEAWQKADFSLQSLGPQQNWEIQIENLYLPMGKVISRVLQYQQHKTVSEDGHQGDIYVLIFESVFIYKKSVVETIVVSKGLDGKWRVASYSVK